MSSTSEPSLYRIHSVLASATMRRLVPGAVFCLGRSTGVVDCRAFGLRSHLPTDIATVDTIFDLASLTKPVATAISVLLLVEQGAIHLDQRVDRHIPEFEVFGKGSATLEQLLLHTSGLPPINPLEAYGSGRSAAVRDICLSVPLSSPGEAFVYSDLGYIILGEIVQRVTGKSLGDSFQALLGTHLGLRSTFFNPAPERMWQCAVSGYRGGLPIRGEAHDPRAFALGGAAGHAGLFSNAADLSVLLQLLLNDGRMGGRQLLSKSTVKLLLEKRVLPHGAGRRTYAFDSSTSYSYAWTESFDHPTLGHTGFTGTMIWLDPIADWFVVLLTNASLCSNSAQTRVLRAAVLREVAEWTGSGGVAR